MVDALPYLVDYPYGCTEQTLNRFLPTVVVQKVLLHSGVDLESLRKKSANLNAQELGDAGKRAERWNRFKHNPIFDSAEVDRMVRSGVDRLVSMQNSDGGWGWFSGYGCRSYPHTTATIVHGLGLAERNSVALPHGVLEKGIDWLKRYQVEEVEKLRLAATKPKDKKWKSSPDHLDAIVLLTLAELNVQDKNSRAMVDFLDRDRAKLAPYSLGMLALAADYLKNNKVRDRGSFETWSNFLLEDNENQTAWLGIPESYRWYWYGDRFETQTAFVKLLCRSRPESPVLPRLVKYLINHRTYGTRWNSTRDTAAAIEAMAEYLKVTGQLRPDMTVTVLVDSKELKKVRITPETLLTFDDRLVLEGESLASGNHKIEIRKEGTGPLYYNAYMTNFTKENPITAAGLEVRVARRYYRLEPVEKELSDVGSSGQLLGRKVEKYRRVELSNLAELSSGDLVEVELLLESKNDYEYLMLTDPKPAGFEPVELRSGYNGNQLGAYVEYRDERTVFFRERFGPRQSFAQLSIAGRDAGHIQRVAG